MDIAKYRKEVTENENTIKMDIFKKRVTDLSMNEFDVITPFFHFAKQFLSGKLYEIEFDKM